MLDYCLENKANWKSIADGVLKDDDDAEGGEEDGGGGGGEAKIKVSVKR